MYSWQYLQTVLSISISEYILGRTLHNVDIMGTNNKPHMYKPKLSMMNTSYVKMFNYNLVTINMLYIYAHDETVKASKTIISNAPEDHQYHNMFPESAITPKMHILQEHVVEWMKTWHVGLGFHSEQGG